MAEQFQGWTPYNYTLQNPVNLTDPTGMAPEDVIKGANRDSANKLHEDMNTVFADKKFDSFRGLLTRGKKNDKSTFDKISADAFKNATNALAGDDLDAVTSVYNAINSNSEFVFEYITDSSNKLSSSGNTAYANVLIESFGDYGQKDQIFTGNNIKDSGGEGLAAQTPKGSHAFIMDAKDTKHLENSRFLTSFHEGFGHGFPNTKGIKGDANNHNAIRYENMIRRVKGIGVMRDGTNPIHGNGKIIPLFNSSPYYK